MKAKLTQLFVFIFLGLMLNNCQTDLYEVDENNYPNKNALKNESQKALYPDLLLPNGLVQKYLTDGLTDEVNKALKEWLDDKSSKLEKECKKSSVCEEKMTYMDQLLFIQRQLDDLGMEDVETITSLCDGYYDEENTYVNITPNNLKLEVAQSTTLNFQIMVGESDCSGDIGWYSDNPNIATVNQQGLVTAISPGITYIGALVEGTNHIYGKSQIEVTETIEKFEIVLVLETGSGTWDITGFNSKYENGVKQSGNEIYAALTSNFGQDFKFGLVGFEHYPVPPWGSDVGYCRSEGWAYEEFEPLISMSPFQNWLSFTDNESSIKEAIAGIQIMCSYHDYPASWNSSPFSAVIKTIENFNWSEDTNKVILLFGKYPATYRPEGGNSTSEGYSGYTMDNVVSLANDKNIRIYTMCNIPDRDTPLYNTSKYEYQTMANRTNGQYTNDVWPVETSVANMISTIKATH